MSNANKKRLTAALRRLLAAAQEVARLEAKLRKPRQRSDRDGEIEREVATSG